MIRKKMFRLAEFQLAVSQGKGLMLLASVVPSAVKATGNREAVGVVASLGNSFHIHSESPFHDTLPILDSIMHRLSKLINAFVPE